ncbi:hypothetical protein B296_00018720, partial [Ensete ventricosum]
VGPEELCFEGDERLYRRRDALIRAGATERPFPWQSLLHLSSRPLSSDFPRLREVPGWSFDGFLLQSGGRGTPTAKRSLGHSPFELQRRLQVSQALFRCIQPSDFSVFDPLRLNKESSLGLGAFWESILDFFSQTFESTASSKKDKSSSKRGVAG